MFGDLVVNLIARVNQFTGPMRAARGILSGFRTQASSAVSGVTSAFGKLSGIGSLVGGAFAGLSVAAAVTWGASMAIEAEKAQIAFSTMLKSPEKAKALLADLSAFAASTPYESPEITDAAKSLLAYGTQAADIVPTLGMLGDVASGVGMPLGEIAYLFGTAQVQGKLFAKDINQFTGRGIPIIQALADVIGVSKDNIMDLASQGKITSGLMEQAFQKMTGAGGQFSGMMAAQSQTTAGLWSTLKDNVGLALRDISAALMEGFDLKGLFADGISFTETFRANIDQWLPVFTQAGVTTREWFTWMISTAGELWDIVSFVFNNFGELGALTVSQVGLYFVTLGNDIAYIFTGLLPAALMGFVGYATSLMSTLLDNISGKMADVKAMLTGGKATHEWKSLSGIEMKVETPGRQQSALEKSMTESIAEQQDRLGAAMTRKPAAQPQAAAAAKKAAGPLFFDDESSADAKATADEVNSKMERKRNKVNEDWAEQRRKANEKAVEKNKKQMAGDLKPAKESGAIGVRTNEAYKAIVAGMNRGKGDGPQEQQLSEMRAIKKVNDEQLKEQRKQRELAEKNQDTTVEIF